MPQLNDGLNKLIQPQLGMMFRLSNGEKSLQAMIDNSNLADPTSFTILAEIQDTRLTGPGPFKAKLFCDGIHDDGDRICTDRDIARWEGNSEQVSAVGGNQDYAGVRSAEG